MRIIILGGGTVGSWIAETLCPDHDVTVIDTNPEVIQRLNDHFDVQAFVGSAIDSTLLFQAQTLAMDLCLAVTGDESKNVLAASMAKRMGCGRAVARIHSPVMFDKSTFDYETEFGIDRLISLEELTAIELAQEIRTPGSVVVEYVARGSIKVQSVQLSKNAKILATPLKELKLPGSVRLGSITRFDEESQETTTRLANAEDVLQADDQILLIGDDEDVDALLDKALKNQKKKEVVIAGGGNVAVYLATILESGPYDAILIERDQERSELLATQLPDVTVLHADATYRQTLLEEHVEKTDFFVACMGDDESNIMTSVEVDDIVNSMPGVEREDKTIVCVVSRPDYAQVISRLGINRAVSPRNVMVEQVQTFLTTGAVISSNPLPGTDIGVYEIEVQSGSAAEEHVLVNLALPLGKCLIAAVSSQGEARVPRGDDHFQAGDYVVALIHEDAVSDVVEKFSGTSR